MAIQTRSWAAIEQEVVVQEEVILLLTESEHIPETVQEALPPEIELENSSDEAESGIEEEDILAWMHRMLNSIRNKTHHLKADWAEQLPFAVYHIFRFPNRDTNISPHGLIFGWKERIPIELLYNGWALPKEVPLDRSAWVAIRKEWN